MPRALRLSPLKASATDSRRATLSGPRMADMMFRKEEGMGHMKSSAVWTAVMMAGLAGGWQVAQGQAPAPSQARAAVAPADSAALRAHYEQWRKEFKTWGKWAPVGPDSKGPSTLVTPQKAQSPRKLTRA